MELLKEGLIEAVELPRVSGEGRWGQVLRLTEKGRLFASVENRRDEGNHNRTRSEYEVIQRNVFTAKREGSLLHKHLSRMSTNRLRQQGFAVEIEVKMGGKEAADIVADNKIAFEVETRDFNESNVEKNLRSGVERVVVVCQTKATPEDQTKILREGFGRGRGSGC